MLGARLKTALIALIRDLTVSSDFVYGYTFRDGVQRGWKEMRLRVSMREGVRVMLMLDS